ncbi:hypothetical protein L2E82_31182 [Cichorium intybus]|uniref:Uncharacterized protein n=1 Tax=Cichorium intybus TaxID=13427 RepID=A0ACB9D2V6_CICIN|nr:hypothetical protein L2E82_31182 [Cichorium intybus]
MANPINTESEINKQVLDSGAKLAIDAPEAMHKLLSTKGPIIVTTRRVDGNGVSMEELIDSGELMELSENKPTQSNTTVII